MYGRIVIERVQSIISDKIGEEQDGFRKGRRCVEQIFNSRMEVEK